MKNAENNKDRLWTPLFIVLTLATLFMFMTGQGANAGTSVYLERIGGSLGLAGFGALMFSFSAAIARIFGGSFIDSHGRQKAIVGGCSIMLFGTIAPLVYNDAIFFVLWRVLQGAGFSIATTAGATAAADILPSSRLGAGIGYYGLGQAIATAIGPAIAIFLVTTNPPENFYIGISLCAAIALILGCLINYEKNPSKLPSSSEYRIRWEDNKLKASETKQTEEIESKNYGKVRTFINKVFEPGALAGTIPIIGMTFCFSFNIFYIGLFGNKIGVTNSGLYFTITAIVMIIIRMSGGKLMDKGRPLTIMGIAVIGGLLSYSLHLANSLELFGSYSSVAFFVAAIPFGICMGLSIPINQTMAVKNSPSSRWGAANALFMLGIDVGNGVLSFVWGFVIEYFGFTVAIIFVLFGICLSLFLALRCYPNE